MIEPNFNIKQEVDGPNYGKFSIEPLEQGYGHTLGNSLRRVLLSSLPGAAITWVKAAGVPHQFSVVSGLKEDVMELILNLKKVRLVVEDVESATLTLMKKGPGKVTAADIETPAGVRIVNPELVLGTLADRKARLEITMIAERGYGYVAADEKKSDELGRIAINALFSPVVRVNYRVEATRVGRMTNLDKLVMEIWTDATIAPFDALKQAAKTLISYLAQMVEPKEKAAEEAASEKTVVSNELLKMRIEELDIPTRVVNALARGGIETIGQLIGTPRADLLKIKNVGTKSLAVVEEKIREKGAALPM